MLKLLKLKFHTFYNSSSQSTLIKSTQNTFSNLSLSDDVLYSCESPTVIKSPKVIKSSTSINLRTNKLNSDNITSNSYSYYLPNLPSLPSLPNLSSLVSYSGFKYKLNRHNKLSKIKRIRKKLKDIKSIKCVISVLNEINNTTVKCNIDIDTLLLIIYTCYLYEPPSDVELQMISHLYQIYSNKLNIEEYAITTLWCCIIYYVDNLPQKIKKQKSWP